MRAVTPEPVESAAPSEEEVYAEHRAALEATLFDPGRPLVLELRDGALRPIRG